MSYKKEESVIRKLEEPDRCVSMEARKMIYSTLLYVVYQWF